MRLVRQTPKKTETLAETQSRRFGFDPKQGLVFASFPGEGPKGKWTDYWIELTPAEALDLASWAISHMKKQTED